MVVSVNLSAAEFQRPDLVQMIRETLRRVSLAPQPSKSRSPKCWHARSRIQYPGSGQLRDLGVAAVIDDFGTGYSNLTVLKQLPIQGIKIDRSLIRDEIREPDEQTVLGAIFGVSHGARSADSGRRHRNRIGIGSGPQSGLPSRPGRMLRA